MNDNEIRVITVGSASFDVFLTGKSLLAKRDVRTKDYVEQFPLGAKLNVDNVYFETGGGATNAAVTFARQGFKVGFVGKVGHDMAGSEVLRVLRKEGVSTEHVAYDSKLTTEYATILLAPNGERTVLVNRGASHNLDHKDFSIRTFEAEWFYISSLAGNFSLLSRLLKHANNHGIQVAFNPGDAELKQAKKLKSLLPLVTVLIANKEEMQLVFEGDTAEEVISSAARTCRYVVLTDGPHGSYATDGNKLYKAGEYQKVKPVDRLGAGDAFGSGFAAALARGDALEDALTFASANATAVVQQIGAKTGILKTQRVKRMKIKVSDLP